MAPPRHVLVGGLELVRRAAALQAGLTVLDLEEVELAYAPQFESAKDPVNLAGFIAGNVLRGDEAFIYAEELYYTSGQRSYYAARILR
ncbi:MAG: hypothetical protein KAY37_08350 [Phycisphaerae bacterium]|nr:hypothetical protein [Phycisphaerae bacterium]